MWTISNFKNRSLYRLIFLLLFFPQEAHMSQVTHVEYEKPISEMMEGAYNSDILIVEGPIENKEFQHIVFPKETHFEKKTKSEYIDHVSAYKVLEVLQSTSLKPGDTIWVWKEPAYTLEDIKKAHEQGLLESPSVRVRTPDFPIEGNRILVFAMKAEVRTKEFPSVYSFWLEEGIAAKKEVKKHLKKWWQFWR